MTSTAHGAVTQAERLASRWWLPRLPSAARWARPPIIWTSLLVSAICFEGLGRKSLPQVPSVVFYFFKDVVLLAGLGYFGVRRPEARSARFLYHGFGLVLTGAFLWTLLEVFNPAHSSIALAVVGIRSYWLWWVAPLVVATALREVRDRERAVVLLALTAMIVGTYAAVQFAMPASAHTYALYGGEEIVPVATVASTGRVRVSSTFGYITGFSDFVVLVPALLLSLGLRTESRKVRILALTGTAIGVAALPMAGSRGPVVLALGTIVLVVGSTGVSTRAIRRVVLAALLVGGLTYFLGREAIEGVEDRFAGYDTRDRIGELLEVLPPVAIARNEYPLLGVGTGMQQNARIALQISSNWESEGEPGRYLIELGVPGYLLVWFARAGLAVALLRAASVLRRARRGAVSGAATAYAFFAIQGNLTFDHVFQALFFVGAGLILAEVKDARTEVSPRLRATVRTVRAGPALRWHRS